MNINFKTNYKHLLLSVFAVMLVSLTSYAQENTPTPEPAKETETKEEKAEEQKEESKEKAKVVAFNGIESVPHPVECKSKTTNDARKQCVSRFIQMHVGRKFDTELPRELGLSPGRKRIYVQFKIDETGKVIDIQSRAEHPDLEKEAERVIAMLPEFIPGEQGGEKVSVVYSLPIVFMVEEPIKKDGKN